jgi:hypothetical protein
MEHQIKFDIDDFNKVIKQEYLQLFSSDIEFIFICLL